MGKTLALLCAEPMRSIASCVPFGNLLPRWSALSQPKVFHPMAHGGYGYVQYAPSAISPMLQLSAQSLATTCAGMRGAAANEFAHISSGSVLRDERAFLRSIIPATSPSPRFWYEWM